MSDFWKRGQISALANDAGMRVSHLSAVLHRSRSVSKLKAIELELASGAVLGYPIRWDEWLFNTTSQHPAFFGAPIKEGGDVV